MFVRQNVFSTLCNEAPIFRETVSTYLHYRACKDEINCLTFDIKHFSLTQPSVTIQQRDYQYHLRRSYDNQKEVAELFILKFANLDKCLVLLPQSVWLRLIRSHQTRTEGAGVVGLASDTLPSLSPFAVYEQDLCDAIDSWMDAATLGRTYRNPTTGVELTGYNPKLTSPPSIIPASSHINNVASYGAIRFLRQEILDSGVEGVELCLNPLAPLFADFHLRVPSITSNEVHLLLVEHKLGQVHPTKDGVSFRLHYGDPKRSPMHPLRQWHWLIFQPQETVSDWYCFGRHDIKIDWTTKGTLSLGRSEVERYRYQDMVTMIEHIEHEASKAILTVQDLLAKRFDADLEVLLTSNAATNETVNARTGPAAGPKIHKKWHSGLHWLFDRFNKQCKNNDSLVLLPLDGRHPYGNYVIAEHTWTPEQGRDFDQTRALPIQAFDAYIDGGQSKRPRRCVVMRFWDMSRTGDTYGAFLTIRAPHRYHPSTDQSYMIVGSILDSDVLANMEQQPQYLLLPSEFQAQLGKPGDKSEHEGDQYYQSRPLTEEERESAVRKGSKDMMNKNIDPLHFLVEFDSIYPHILNLMSENGENEIRIKNPQTNTDDLTPPILKEKYLTTLSKVHQAAWDFGCT